MKQTQIKTKEEARQKAIDWQYWASEQGFLSTKDLIDWVNYFETLAKKYHLKREYKENGII